MRQRASQWWRVSRVAEDAPAGSDEEGMAPRTSSKYMCCSRWNSGCGYGGPQRVRTGTGLVLSCS